MTDAPATLRRLTIAPDGRGGWRVTRETGPDPAQALVGRTPEEAARLAPLVFNLCGAAHAFAAAGALGLPAAGDARAMARETVRDHALAILHAWPGAMGLPPDRTALSLLARPEDEAAFAAALVGDGSDLPAFAVAEMEAWLREAPTGTARLLARLRHEADPAEGRVRLPELTAEDVAGALEDVASGDLCRRPPSSGAFPSGDSPPPLRGRDREGSVLPSPPSRRPAFDARSSTPLPNPPPQGGRGKQETSPPEEGKEEQATFPPQKGRRKQETFPLLRGRAWAEPAGAPASEATQPMPLPLRETGALGRVSGTPLVAALLAAEGPSLFVRLLARLVDCLMALTVVPALRATPLFATPLFATPLPVPRPGLGLAQAARGLLGHAARIEAGRVAAYRILSPSAFNLCPGGLMERAFAALTPGPDAHWLAPLLVSAVNPCVPVTLALEREPAYA